jgi:hypothetical protein
MYALLLSRCLPFCIMHGQADDIDIVIGYGVIRLLNINLIAVLHVS